MDCEIGNHKYIVVEEFTGGTRYRCRECGYEYVESTLLNPNDLAEYFLFLQGNTVAKKEGTSWFVRDKENHKWVADQSCDRRFYDAQYDVVKIVYDEGNEQIVCRENIRGFSSIEENQSINSLDIEGNSQSIIFENNCVIDVTNFDSANDLGYLTGGKVRVFGNGSIVVECDDDNETFQVSSINKIENDEKSSKIILSDKLIKLTFDRVEDKSGFFEAINCLNSVNDSSVNFKNVFIKENFRASNQKSSLYIETDEGETYTIPFGEIRQIIVRTTSMGPIFDDMFAEIITDAAKYIVGSENPLYKTIIFDILGSELELDYKKLTEAAVCVLDNEFVIYPIVENEQVNDEAPETPDRLKTTGVLTEDSLKLTVLSKQKDFWFTERNSVTIGSDVTCDLRIVAKPNYISRKHIVLERENGKWFVTDANSTNGTWLNDIKLEPGEKYQLNANDVIDLAHSEKIIFAKNVIQLSEEEKAIIVMERAIKSFRDSEGKDDTAVKLIIVALSDAPMYLPVSIDMDAMFKDIDPTSLKAGDTITTSENVRMRISTLKIEDKEIIPIFTSDVEVHKGPATSVLKMYPMDYMPKLIAAQKDVVINPFGGEHFVVTYTLLNDIIWPFIKQKYEAKCDITSEKKNDEDLIGKVIEGKYQILSLLGVGGITKVYLAQHNDKKYAIKTFNHKIDSNKSIIGALLGEVDLLRRLNHPSIRQVVDFIQDDNYTYIVMEYVEGISLEHMMQKNGGPLPEQKVIKYGIQIAKALSYAHSQNPPIINRDIKPRNILVNANDNIKLVDFDIAMPFDPSKDDICIVGTKGYAAPEQYSGKSTPRTDIYQLGITMHQLLTGIDPTQPPYEMPPIRKVNSSLSKGLEKIISKCISLDPDKRYSNCLELVAALENEQNSKPGKSFLGNLFSK